MSSTDPLIGAALLALAILLSCWTPAVLPSDEAEREPVAAGRVTVEALDAGVVVDVEAVLTLKGW